MAEEVLNLQQKLSKIRKMTEVIQKNRKGFNYKYTSIDEILARVTAGMNKYNVSLIPSIVPGSESIEPYTYCKTKFTKDGQQYEEKNNEFTAKAGIVYTWVNDDDPTDRIDVPWFIAGSQADPAQAVGSGLTYGLRQFLMQFFQIATLDGEDPDDWRSKQRFAEGEEDRAIAGKIVEQIHGLVTAHLSQHPDDKPKVITLTKKYVRENGKPSANYYAVETPAQASELFEALKQELGVK